MAGARAILKVFPLLWQIVDAGCHWDLSWRLVARISSYGISMCLLDFITA
jgi:hypothetical protein